MGLFGERGAGKSAVMAWYGLQEAEHGRPIFYYPEDFSLKCEGAEAMSPEELVSMPDRMERATILIDEVQEVLSKFRAAATSSLLLMSFFRQTRKRGANVIFTSNDPGGINSALANQTDFHGQCKMIEDMRCYQLGYHRKFCTDTVRIRIKDTQGKYGLVQGRKDGRKGFVQLVMVSDVYPLYNTASIADLSEVMRLTKSNLINRKDDENYAELDRALRQDIVPSLASQGLKVIVPGLFVDVLKRERNIDIDPSILGKRLRRIGLPVKKTSKANVYQLPNLEQLPDWLDGVWDGPDE
jgi:hypothetical protein